MGFSLNFKMKRVKVRVKAVIFDMDGVITNTMPDHFRIWKRIFAGQNINVGRTDVYKREGQRGINSVLEIFSEHGRTISPKAAKTILQTKERLFKKSVRRRFIPGARRFLKNLHDKGIMLALVTGTSRSELRKILPAHLAGLFDVIVTGSDVTNGKPHPEPFLAAIKKLNIPRRKTVVIENAPFGIQSAKKAGLKCFALETSLSRKYLKGADRIFSSFRHFQDSVQILSDS